jgi:cytochrome c-type biogenesis protein CcmH/NrfG
MKNVQMRINPELYAKFKLVDGESNNERMAKLLIDSQEKYQLIESCENVLLSAKELRAVNVNKNATIKILASALVVSIAVSACSVAYVCVVNGWFA